MAEYFNAIMTHDFATLCTGAIEVFRHSCSDKKERFERMERLLNRARTLGNERNTVAHGLWLPFQEGGKVIHVPRSLKAKISIEQAKGLEDKADQANALRAEIEAIGLEIWSG